MSAAPFAVHVAHLDGSASLALDGELDIVTAPMLRGAVDDLVSAHLSAVHLDLSALTFCDITGMKVLEQARQTAVAIDAKFRLTGVSEFLDHVITIARFDDLAACVDKATVRAG